jgi:hypothetical protein
MPVRALDHVVNRCLALDPNERWQTASDLRGEPQWVASSAGSTFRGRRLWASLAAVSVCLALVFAFVLFRRGSSPSSALAMRFAITIPKGVALRQVDRVHVR